MLLVLMAFRFWGFLYYQHRHDIRKLTRSDLLEPNSHCIVPVQNYITAILLFLVVEMLMTWGFYGEM
jgi:hypothetical protein